MPHDASTLSLTPGPSVSGLTLNFGAVAHINGLELPEGLSFDQWKMIGTQLVQIHRSAAFMIGDWLAYGQASYKNTVYAPQLEDGRLDMASEIFGLEPGTLKNYKRVCQAVDLSRRRDGLTMRQLTEIVNRVPSGQVDYWQEKAVKESLSGGRLRMELRTAFARHSNDPVPPADSFIAKIEEFTDWISHEFPTWKEPAQATAARKLAPVHQLVAPFLAKPTTAAAKSR